LLLSLLSYNFDSGAALLKLLACAAAVSEVVDISEVILKDGSLS
jgi:hypothetical protein